jgi:hypothetical protein
LKIFWQGNNLAKLRGAPPRPTIRTPPDLAWGWLHAKLRDREMLCTAENAIAQARASVVENWHFPGTPYPQLISCGECFPV